MIIYNNYIYNMSSKRKLSVKSSSSSNSSKKVKESKESNDLARLWAWIIINISNNWVFNCDSGCYYEICQKEVHTEGSYMAIYQPTKGMITYDNFIAAIIIKRTDKKPITLKMFTDANSDLMKVHQKTLSFDLALQALLAKVQNLFLESYNNILKITNNKWTSKTDGTFDSIIQSTEKLQLVDGTLKFKFKIRGAINGCCGDKWNPDKLIKWFDNTDTKEIDEDELKKYNMDALLAIL